MKGFDAEFSNLDHYIRVITARIWEGRRIDDIHKYYSDPCVVETPMSVSTAIEDVITSTRATLVMFPDRRLLAEDVIQSGQEEGGFLSSHRIISTMTHAGDGSFGPATGARIHVRTVADCVCKDNRVIHEWLVRDQAAIALQIGSMPQVLAQAWLNQRGGWHKPVAPTAPAGYVSHISQHPQAQAYVEAIKALAQGDGDVSAIYDEAAQQISPGEHTSYGHDEIDGFWRSVFGALRVQQFTVEHLAWQQDHANSDRNDRLSLRFRAKTVHRPRDSSLLRYGRESGREVEVMGIVHAEFVHGRVLREWVLIDDVALWMQVLVPQA